MAARLRSLVAALVAHPRGSLAVTLTALLSILGIAAYVGFVVDQTEKVHDAVLGQARVHASDLSDAAASLETDFRSEVAAGTFDAALTAAPEQALTVPERARRFVVRHQAVVRSITVTAPDGASMVITRDRSGHYYRRRGVAGGASDAPSGRLWTLEATRGRGAARVALAVDVGALMADSITPPAGAERALSALIDAGGSPTALVEARNATTTLDVDLGLDAHRRHLAQRLEFSASTRLRLGSERWQAIIGVSPATLLGRPVAVAYSVERNAALRQLWSSSLLLLALFVALALHATATAIRLLARRHQIDVELRASRQHLQLAMRGADLGMWDWDLATDTVTLDERWSEILGYAPGESPTVSASLAEMTLPEDRPRVEAAIRRHLAGAGSWFDLEFRAVGKDGALRWIHCRGGVVERDAAGRPVRVAGTNRDCTVEHGNREALRRSEARKAAILDASFSAVLTVGSGGKVEEVNAAAQGIFGIRSAQAQGRDLSDFVSLSADEAVPGQVGALAPLAAMAGHRIEGWALRPSGDRLPVEISVAALADAGPGSFAVFVQDLTLQRAAEKALRETAETLAEARNREIGISSHIQRALLMEPEPTELAGMAIAAMSLASDSIDGDYVDFVKHSPTVVDVLVGDVMGKGLPAAMLAAATKGHFTRAMARLDQALRPHGRMAEPEEVVSAAHRTLTPQLADLDAFVTLCFARLDVEAMRVTVVDCGHPPMLHYRAQAGRCHPLSGKNMPLGFVESEVYRQHTTPIGPGDAFLAVSDGVTEARSPSGELFGLDRLALLLEECAGQSAQQVVEHVRQAAVDYTGNEALADDFTCVAVVVDEKPVQSVLAFDTIEVKADEESVESVSAYVHGFVSLHMPSMPSADAAALATAVHEAVRNIVARPVEGDGAMTLVVEVAIEADRARVRILDRAGSMDPHSMGWGQLVIGMSVDHMTRDRDELGRNRLTLEKMVNPSH